MATARVLPVAEPTILFVGAPSQVTPAAESARETRAAIDIAAVTAEALATADLVVVDIDLADAGSRERLRTALARMKRPPLLVFAVDRGAHFHLQQTQANALGASAVIRRPLNRDGIDEALAELGVHRLPEARRERRSGPRPELKSIAAAHHLIGASFTALSTGGRLDMEEAAAASRDLLAGVGQSGLHAWLDTVRAHHAGTFQHCLLVTGAVVAYVNHADVSPEARTELALSALLHDIGKAEIPNAILDKPSALTPAEFAIVQRHPRIGADYLRQHTGLSASIIEPVLHHHEFLDGSSYPDRLKGAEISPATRIMTVCDIYGALVEARAYKSANTPAEALYVLIGMAQKGKVDFAVVRRLAAALGVALPGGSIA